MSWDNVKPIQNQLIKALNDFDWAQTEGIIKLLIKKVHAEENPIPNDGAKFFLSELRRKRQFRLMALLADALLLSGQRSPLVRRQYAQALIDQGMLTAPDLLLQSIIQDPQGEIGEEMEARGLVGRIYKQLYVNIGDSRSPRNRINMMRALNEYMYVYRLDAQENVWHGINVVALLHRARRDGLPLPGMPDPAELAKDVLAAMPGRWRKEIEKAREKQVAPPLHMPAFDVATALEALIALGRYDAAQVAAIEYAGLPDADEFEIASTLRQMEEVWQLNDKDEPGSWLLPILRAARLRRNGSFLKLQTEEVTAGINSIRNFISGFDPEQVATLPWYAEGREAQKSAARAVGKGEEYARMGYEKKYIQDGTATAKWMEVGLRRSGSVARVDDADARGHGTSWLVNASDFCPGREGVLLMTNAHVVSERRVLNSLKPTEARINFKESGGVFEVKPQILWFSPMRQYDAALLEFKGDPPSVEPLPLSPDCVEMPDPNEECDPPKLPPRLYIIGYPEGGEILYSMEDNRLLACKDHLLHYRTPTDEGSSGSPVFGPAGWKVVALHHRGKQRMERIDGQDGYYEANEGISILAIQEAARQAWSSRQPQGSAE